MKLWAAVQTLLGRPARAFSRFLTDPWPGQDAWAVVELGSSWAVFLGAIVVTKAAGRSVPRWTAMASVVSGLSAHCPRHRQGGRGPAHWSDRERGPMSSLTIDPAGARSNPL